MAAREVWIRYRNGRIFSDLPGSEWCSYLHPLPGYSSYAHLALVLTAYREPSIRFRPTWERAARWPDVHRASLCHQQFGDADAPPQETIAEIDHLDRLVVRLATPGRMQ